MQSPLTPEGPIVTYWMPAELDKNRLYYWRCHLDEQENDNNWTNSRFTISEEFGWDQKKYDQFAGNQFLNTSLTPAGIQLSQKQVVFHVESSGFDDSGCQSGPSGFGFGDDDDATIIPQTISVYIRTPFDVDDCENIAYGLLHIDYDDAFVAYINGTEIARANMQGEAGVPPAYNEFAYPFNREALMYKGGDPEVQRLHT